MAPGRQKKRDLFGELMEGVSAMRSHRQGRFTPRSHQIDRLTLPAIGEHVIRTLERWEQGRSKPNDQAAELILLVRKYPDMLKRLQQLAEAS